MNIIFNSRALITYNDQFLILKRADDDANSPGVWSLPGGGEEPSERPNQTVIREVKEETGLKITVGELLTTHHFAATEPNTAVVVLTFHATTNSNIVTLNKEHSEYKWLSIKDDLTQYKSSIINNVAALLMNQSRPK
jgi:8-oxo-dGTP diphosphatase